MKAIVSVIVVNYNSGAMLKPAVERVVASSVPVQLIVVDNASTDQSMAGLAHDFPVVVIQNQENLGFAAACNQGMAQAQAEYILLLNPDCLVEPDTLARMIGAMEASPKAGMAGCRILNPDGSEQKGCRRNLPDVSSGLAKAFNKKPTGGASKMDMHLDSLPDQPIYVPAISGAFMLVRRAAYVAVGDMDEDYFLHCEDLDWCKRFADKDWGVLFVPGVAVTHHQGSCSQIRPMVVEWHKHAGMWKYYKKHLASSRSWLMGWMVFSGIWSRFSALSLRSLFKGKQS